MIEGRQFYINGKWVAPNSPRDCEVIDPSTERACAVISLGDQADTDAAVAAARAAFPSWSATDPQERRALVERILQIYNTHIDEMASAISMEMGSPIDHARSAQASSAPWHIEGFLSVWNQIEWETRVGDEVWLYEPIGVVGMITPWNWPMNQVALKVIPALLAGCTMVLKPSEIAPLSSLVWAKVMDQAGTPAGVFNLVNGDGEGVGTQLARHMDVDMVSFTGSTRAGRLVSQGASTNLKRVSLELGGKGANIVFADAGADAVTQGVRSCFGNTGQSCNAPTRMLVERARYDAAVREAGEAAQASLVGPSASPGRHMGPVVSKAQFDKIQALIQSGIDDGARLVCGGPGRPEGLETGYFVRPTVFADVTTDMAIYKEEIFGPVLAILAFDTEEEAIAIANDTPYGLTNYVQSNDDAKRARVARQLRSGMVQTNYIDFAPGSPFGGMKQSGNGREGGLHGLREFQEVKAISGLQV